MPQRNVATHFTFEQQRQEINLLASDFWTQKQTVDTAADTYLKADGSVATTAALTLGGNLVVPNAFTINPDSGSGTVTISGNLQVDGTTTTLNSATLEIADKNLVIASGSSNDAASNGGGITLKGTDDKTITYNNTGDKWVSNKDFEAPSLLGIIKTNDGAGSVLIPGATSNDFSQLYNTVLYNSNGQAILSVTAGSEHFNGVCEGLTGTPDITVGDVIASSLEVSGTSTFGTDGSITAGANFSLSSNQLRVTGTDTVGLEVQRAGNATIQCTDTTNTTDLQLRANATGGLVRTAGAFPLILGTAQEERLRIHESNAFVTINSGNAENNSALVLSKTDSGYAKLEFDVGTSQKAYVELDASESLVHYGASGTQQQFYTNGNASPVLTLDTSQNATFTGDINLSEGKKTIFGSDSGNGGYIKHQSGHFEIKNETGNCYWDNSGNIRIRTQTSNSYTDKLEITSDKIMASVDFKPHAHHSIDIGTASNAFKDIYSETITTTSVYDSRGSVRRIGPVSPVGVYDVVPGVGGTTGRYVFTTYDVRLANGMTAGDVVTIINNGSSDITIDAATNSVTLTNSADASTGDRTLASKGMATVLYVGSATAFISGAGLS